MKNTIARILVCLTVFLMIQRVDAAAVVDRGFGDGGTATTAVGAELQAKKIKIQPDGKIVALGTTGTGASQTTTLVRYEVNGALDASFGSGGIVTANLSPDAENANDLAFQSNGKIIVVGSFYSPATQSVDFFAARFDQNGSLDASFGANGIASVNQSSVDVFNAVAVQADDKIVAVGATSQNNYDFAAVRFNAHGSLDPTFRDGGLFFLDLSPFSNQQFFRAVTLFPNGRILIGGTFLDSGANNILVVLEANGSYAQNFGNGGVVQEYFGPESTGVKFDFALLPDGSFLAVSRASLRRYFINGVLDSNFRRVLAGAFVTIAGTDLAVRSDGRFYVLNHLRFPTAETTAYEPNGREINRVRDLTGADIEMQNDDKFFILKAFGDSFVLTRYLSISSTATRVADFDYDGKTDLIVSRLGQTVYVLRSAQSVTSYQLNRSVGEGVRVIPEDFYFSDPSQFPLYYWRYSGQNSPAFFESVNEAGARLTYQWGISGDIPVGGDYDGFTFRENNLFRRSSELSIFRPSTGDWWIFNRRTNTFFAYHWGANGDKPVPADYDYDGITDFAVYRPSTGTWWIHRSGDDSYFTVQFGNATDTPLTGDFDGDGKADFTVYRASEGNWYQFLTSEGFRVVRFGLPTDTPVPGDYDGDGKHDIAVFRGGIWYLLQSTNGFAIVQWGNATDMPIAVRYDQ